MNNRWFDSILPSVWWITFFLFFLVDFNNCRLFYSTSEHLFFLFLRIDGWKVVNSTSENDFFLLLNFLIMSHTVKQYRWGRASWTQFKFVMWQIHKSDRITEAGAILHFYLSRWRASVLVKEKWGRLHSKLDEKTEVNQKMAICCPQGSANKTHKFLNDPNVTSK